MLSLLVGAIDTSLRLRYFLGCPKRAGLGVMSQYCSLRYLRWFNEWCTVNLRNGRSRTFVRCVWRVSAFHHPWFDCSTAGFTQQFRRRLTQQPIPCFLALRGEGPQIGLTITHTGDSLKVVSPGKRSEF